MYNSFAMMTRNLEVLSKQTAVEIELIIVDDCSKDNSFLMAKEYAEKSTLNIKVLQNEKNSGPGCSRNHGIKYATGDYITFVDSDDYFSENFTEVLSPLLEENYDCVIFDYINVDESGNIISSGRSVGTDGIQPGQINRNEALVYTYGTTWGKIYRLEIIHEHNVRFGEFFRNEDTPFTKHALAVCRTIYYLPDKLYKYVQNAGSLMHNDRLLDEKNGQTAFALLRGRIDESAFKEELLAIELREVLNNTVMIKILKNEPNSEIKRYIKEHYRKEHFNNRYFSGYPFYVKVMSYMAYIKCLTALRTIYQYKVRKRR